jgi:NAD/NADP transhydrogenase beta subunit
MSTVMINLWYVVAAALFIFGLEAVGLACHGCARQQCFPPWPW